MNKKSLHLNKKSNLKNINVNNNNSNNNNKHKLNNNSNNNNNIKPNKDNNNNNKNNILQHNLFQLVLVLHLHQIITMHRCLMI
eukprot:UN04081